MWMLIERRRRPDARYWPGRRGMALLDALAWPAGWIVAALHVPSRGGLVGGFVIAAAVFASVRRMRRAVWRNERYFFSTLCWGKVAMWLFLLGLLLRLILVG